MIFALVESNSELADQRVLPLFLDAALDEFLLCALGVVLGENTINLVLSGSGSSGFT